MARVYCLLCNYSRGRTNSGGRIYCPRCRKRYSVRRVERERKIIEYFALEIPANKASKVLKVNYRTVYRAYQALRTNIAQKTGEEFRKPSGEIAVDDAYFGGRRKGRRGGTAAGKVVVLGMLERRGKVFTTVVEGMSAVGVSKAIRNTAEKGSVFYTDRYRSYKSLFLVGRHFTLDHAQEFTNGRVHINGLEGFWSFAKERMFK